MSFRLDDLSQEMLAQIEDTYGPDGTVKPEHEFDQECEGCHARLPADDDYFFFKEGELQQPCKACRRNQQDDEHEMALVNATKMATAYLGSNAIGRVAKGELAEVPGIETLAESIGQVFCGESGIAMLMYKEFFSQKPNAVRVRMLELMTKVFKFADEAKEARKGKDSREVSEEDMRAALAKFAKMVEGTGGRIKGQKAAISEE